MGTVSGKGSTMKRKRYSRKFQRMAVERMRTCEDVGELARELRVTRRCLYKWRTKLEVVEPGEEASRPSTHAAAHRKEIQARRLWRNGIYEQIREVMPLQGSLSIERLCQLVAVSRRSFYRSLKERQPTEEEMEVRSAIQQIALEHRRRYGYRRITAELHRRGMQVNHKRVVRIMREDSLLGMQPKRFVVTTNSNHKLEIYLNLASRLRLKAEFVYLAVILDGFSRKVVGWALDR